jgi:hypothetical protein
MVRSISPSFQFLGVSNLRIERLQVLFIYPVGLYLLACGRVVGGPWDSLKGVVAHCPGRQCYPQTASNCLV